MLFEFLKQWLLFSKLKTSHTNAKANTSFKTILTLLKIVFLHSNSAHKPLYTPNYTWQIKCKTLLSCVFCLFSEQWSTQGFVTALTRTCMCTNTLYTQCDYLYHY